MLTERTKLTVVACSTALAGILQGCSGGDSTGTAPDASPDRSVQDSSLGDTSLPDTNLPDTSPAPDSMVEDAGIDTGTDTGTDAGCPSSWTVVPVVPGPIAVPDGGGGVLLHAAGAGTQDYTCSQTSTDAGPAFAWVFVGPEADLSDCMSAKIGKHFASDGGAARPEWQTSDGTFVIGKKDFADTPDGGAAAIPWLLLSEVANGGSGVLASSLYIQRINTTGGLAPAASTCDAASLGTTEKVPYTADYYFYGP